MKKIISFIAAAVIGSAISLGGYKFLETPKTEKKQIIYSQPAAQLVSNLQSKTYTGLDFTKASASSLETVVHIRSISHVKNMYGQRRNPWADLFGDEFGYSQRENQLQQSTGSGVIVSTDGYIITNNHVIDEAEEVEITTHDNRTYKAKVIGTDTSTDIALLKIDEKNLPFINFANSDGVLVGQWVLAVGNPFNLSSTVTAGIVSAKARNINILKDKRAIESFIQTDAAVNPGNSGGALVNLEGKLIGINTAIATPTGTFAGYSFAVPSNIAKKVYEDLKEFGVIQRAYLGIYIRDLNSNLAEEMNLNISKGVFVDSIIPETAAANSDIKNKDIIVSIDGVEISRTPQLMEQVARHRPGDKIIVSLVRDGKMKKVEVILKNKEGKTDIIKKENIGISEILGAEFKKLTPKELRKNRLRSGVLVSKIKKGGKFEKADIREGFIITQIDNKSVKTPQEVIDILNKKKGGILIEGIYPGYLRKFYYGLGM